MKGDRDIYIHLAKLEEQVLNMDKKIDKLSKNVEQIFKYTKEYREEQIDHRGRLDRLEKYIPEIDVIRTNQCHSDNETKKVITNLKIQVNVIYVVLMLIVIGLLKELFFN